MEKRSGEETSNRHGRFLRYVPLLLWIGLILFASTSQASMSSTSRFVRPVLEFLFPNASEATLVIYHGYIRKTAHFVEYAVLALLAARAFRFSGRELLRRYWPALAPALVLLVAVADEFNQSLNPARTGSVYDVLIDLAGGVFMTAVVYFVVTGDR